MNIKIMKTTFIVGILLMSLLALAVPMVSAEAQGATKTVGETEDIDSVVVDSHEAQAGDITNINFTADSQTFKWQGYFGNVTGNIILANNAGNNMFLWDYENSDDSLVIATTNNALPAWSNIAITDPTDLVTIDTNWYLGDKDAVSDSASDTFEDDTGVVPEFNAIKLGPTMQVTLNSNYRELVLKDVPGEPAKSNILFVACLLY